MSDKENSSIELRDVVGNSILTTQNARFERNGDLPSLIKTNPDGSQTPYKKIYLVRNFPFEYEFEYITVLDENMKEVGIIRDCHEFSPEEAEILMADLNRRYYMPKIKTIIRMKEKMGFSNWTVETDFGTITFSVKDTYKSVVKLPNGRFIITDVDGNRYEIPSISKLDKKSYKKIELII